MDFMTMCKLKGNPQRLMESPMALKSLYSIFKNLFFLTHHFVFSNHRGQPLSSENAWTNPLQSTSPAPKLI